ncbi:MAG TPA: restriction endonuclease subunit S [Ignavibacteriaceae bacterium]|nr:restriction endonuclease subunit S [Ignavibacteriaceae bacterium]
MKKSEFKKYPKYKHSGIEWIGEIPEGWEVKKLRFIGRFTSSGIDKKINENETRVKIINYTDVYGNSSLVLNSDREYMEVTCSEEKHLDHQVIKGDLIFTPSSETTEDIGLSALVNEDLENTAYSYHVLRFRFEKEADHNFKKYLGNNHFVLNQFSSNAKGTTRQILNRENFNSTFVVLPPKSEQTAIANYLDDKTAKIDTLIEKKKKLIELCKEERTAVINEAVTKGLNHDSHDLADEHDKKNHGNPLIKLNQGSDTKMKDSGIDWLGQIPQHWEVKKLKYVGNIVLGKMLTNDDKGGYYLKPYLRAANLQWFKVNVEDVKEMWFSEAELEKLRIEEFDLLVSEGGEVGRTCIWQKELEECFIQNSVHKITIEQNQDPLFFLYLMYYLGSIGLFESIVNRISIAHLTGEKIKDIPVWHPHKTEQHQIVQYIEAETKRIDGKIARTEKEIELLREYRTALISEVVTGKIKVC